MWRIPTWKSFEALPLAQTTQIYRIIVICIAPLLFLGRISFQHAHVLIVLGHTSRLRNVLVILKNFSKINRQSYFCEVIVYGFAKRRPFFFVEFLFHCFGSELRVDNTILTRLREVVQAGSHVKHLWDLCVRTRYLLFNVFVTFPHVHRAVRLQLIEASLKLVEVHRLIGGLLLLIHAFLKVGVVDYVFLDCEHLRLLS